MKATIAYVPVLHKGYTDFFMDPRLRASHLLVLSQNLAEDTEPYLRKEIRALDSQIVCEVLGNFRLFESVSILDRDNLEEVKGKFSTLFFPDDDVSRTLVEKYFFLHKVEFLPVFLRWDKKNTVSQVKVVPKSRIPISAVDRELLSKAEALKGRSSDWWRQIGAVLLAGSGEIIVAWNKHVPSEYRPYIEGDPRNVFSKGLHIELSTAIHAESAVIAKAAFLGVSTLGAKLYVTTFPCPPCAYHVGASGVKKVFFKEGYSMLDGQTILEKFGVEIIEVLD